MAWIESHQSLKDHPKTRKLARLLETSIPATLGHLHCLWWWSIDYADDGDLSRHDALDIAIGGEWDADPDEFVDALVRVGFLDKDEVGLHIHDWNDYAGKLIERRKANAERMRDARANRELTTDKPRAAHVQRTHDARVERPYQPTVPTVNQPTEREGDETSPLAQIPDSVPAKVVSIAEKPKPQKRPHRLPDDFTPTDELKTWAKNEQGLTDQQIAAETEKFRNHFIGTGKPHVDWAATWRNWMIRIGEFAPSRASPNGSKPRTPPLIESSQPPEISGFRAMSEQQRAARRQQGA